MKTKKLVGYKCFCDNFFLFWFLPFLFLFLLQTLEKYLLKKKGLGKISDHYVLIRKCEKFEFNHLINIPTCRITPFE
jgi:hypothetical protein